MGDMLMSKTRKETADAADAAKYIGTLTRELRGIAAEHDFGFLAYLLAMAGEEAQETVRRVNERGSNTKAA